MTLFFFSRYFIPIMQSALITFATTLFPLTQHGRHHKDRPAGSCKLLKRFSGGLFRNFHGQICHSI